VRSVDGRVAQYAYDRREFIEALERVESDLERQLTNERRAPRLEAGERRATRAGKAGKAAEAPVLHREARGAGVARLHAIP
jgi:hypothetical protein